MSDYLMIDGKRVDLSEETVKNLKETILRPKFEVGQKWKHKNDENIRIITKIKDTFYAVTIDPGPDNFQLGHALEVSDPEYWWDYWTLVD